MCGILEFSKVMITATNYADIRLLWHKYLRGPIWWQVLQVTMGCRGGSPFKFQQWVMKTCLSSWIIVWTPVGMKKYVTSIQGNQKQSPVCSSEKHVSGFRHDAVHKVFRTGIRASIICFGTWKVINPKSALPTCSVCLLVLALCYGDTSRLCNYFT